MAKLYYQYGTMSSAKSALLLMKAHSFEERDIQFICMKPSIDTRDGNNCIYSRIGMKRECITIDSDLDLYDFITTCLVEIKSRLIDTPKWILIDECQFLTGKQVEDLAMIVDEYNINVICYGLRTDFRTLSFEGSKRLFELADEINEIKISCKCGRKAIINARLNQNGDIITEGEQVLLGGNEIYVPLCRKCYNEKLKKIKTDKKYYC